MQHKQIEKTKLCLSMALCENQREVLHSLLSDPAYLKHRSMPLASGKSFVLFKLVDYLHTMYPDRPMVFLAKHRECHSPSEDMYPIKRITMRDYAKVLRGFNLQNGIAICDEIREFETVLEEFRARGITEVYSLDSSHSLLHHQNAAINAT